MDTSNKSVRRRLIKTIWVDAPHAPQTQIQTLQDIDEEDDMEAEGTSSMTKRRPKMRAPMRHKSQQRKTKRAERKMISGQCQEMSSPVLFDTPVLSFMFLVQVGSSPLNPP